MPSPPAGSRRRILVFEPDAEGHSLEWLEHLMAFVADEADGTEIHLLAPPSLCDLLARSIPTRASDRIRLLPLSRLEWQLCTTRLLSLSAFARWWTMRRHLRDSGAQSGFFLTIDLLALPLALGLGAGGPAVSGILFRPSVHYGALGPYAPSRGERLRDWRKEVLYRLMLRNRSLSRVLSLDPFFPAYARAHYAHGGKVQALPDPAHPPVEQTSPPARTGDFVPPGRVGFLLFGYLAERKGPLAVLDALGRLSPAIAARVAVLFAGRVDPGLRERLEQKCHQLKRERPELWLRIDDRRLDRGELACLVRQSDVVLAPYQRFVGSSGVLLWAARAGRPVLAQEFGLVGRLTRDHGLGVAVDSSDPAQLAREVTRMVECGPTNFINHAAARRFAEAQTPQRFASLVLSV
jgi:glycosyltransferase involved in cell wall biosynthesis